MSNAICTVCGKEYNWHSYRGASLKDNPSPCCRAQGKAVGNHIAPPKKVCPECGKAGLWWRKAMRNDNIRVFAPRAPDAPEPCYGGMYCPRCKKWIKAVLKSPSENRAENKREKLAGF